MLKWNCCLTSVWRGKPINFLVFGFLNHYCAIRHLVRCFLLRNVCIRQPHFVMMFFPSDLPFSIRLFSMSKREGRKKTGYWTQSNRTSSNSSKKMIRHIWQISTECKIPGSMGYFFYFVGSLRCYQILELNHQLIIKYKNILFAWLLFSSINYHILTNLVTYWIV